MQTKEVYYDLDKVTLEDLLIFWEECTYIDKNKQIRHSVKKRDLMYIGRKYLNFTRKQISKLFNIKLNSVTANICNCNIDSVNDVARELGYWKYKQLNK